MIASVFFCQSIGQLLATMFAYAATKSFQSWILDSSDAAACSIHATDASGVTCARSIDQIWRLVSGLGAVPAAIAIVFRWTIPESVSTTTSVVLPDQSFLTWNRCIGFSM